MVLVSLEHGLVRGVLRSDGCIGCNTVEMVWCDWNGEKKKNKNRNLLNGNRYRLVELFESLSVVMAIKINGKLLFKKSLKDFYLIRKRRQDGREVQGVWLNVKQKSGLFCFNVRDDVRRSKDSSFIKQIQQRAPSRPGPHLCIPRWHLSTLVTQLNTN